MNELNKIAIKWQKLWAKAKIFEANPNKKNKFFVNFPIPYMNAVPHVGHFYTFMRVEAFARYKRLKGFNVLFPQGWHCTGSPIVAAANRIEEGEKNQINSLKEQGFNDKDIKKLKDPEEWTKVFPKIWKETYSLLGISYDKRRSFITTSLNPCYNRFIEWQFRKLKEKGYVIKGKHPVVWDPKTNMPVGDHDRIKGEGETPQEFVLLKFKLGSEYIISATLRPETVFGQTNLWISPDSNYVKTKVNEETWIISESCAQKLKNQGKSVKILAVINGKHLIGKYARAPMINKDIIILPSSFCDLEKGTGIVSSVPSDAPDDYIGLRDLWNDEKKVEAYGLDYKEIVKIKPISIINSGDFGDLPAIKIVEEMGIKNQNEREKLEEARKIVYKKGFYEGMMNENCGEYNGIKVIEAKNKIINSLLKSNKAEIFYELTGEVVSRSLTKCVIKIVSDQWFIKYSDKKWKHSVHELLGNLRFYPERIRDQFTYVIDWLNDWACTREYGLGTKLPYDQKWVIESLSDSTIYMAYYTIAHLIKEVPIEYVNDRLFDYVFLGKGVKPKIKNVNDMKKEFEYWYPFDFRNSGKDLVQNHLTFLLFNHTAILPKKYFPKGIGVNGWVKVEGEKMSKSLGNVISIKDIVEKYGVDAVRFSILSGGEELDDTNWDSNFAQMISNRLIKFYNFSINNYNKGSTQISEIDNWMNYELNNTITKTEEFMDKTLFRSALQKIFFDLQKNLNWYLKRTDKPNIKTLNRYIETQTLLLSPFTPHLCEEIWKSIGNKEFISNAKWPETVKVNYLGNEDYIKKVIEDIRSILKIVKAKPTKAYIYSVPEEKNLLCDAKEFFNREFNMEFAILSKDEKNLYDPKQKSNRAINGKVAIYLE